MSAFGGKADMTFFSARMSAFDPKRTLIAPLGHSILPLRCLVMTLGAAVRRREFITLLSGTAAILPIASWAQQRGQVARVGVLMSTAAKWVYVGRNCRSGSCIRNIT